MNDSKQGTEVHIVYGQGIARQFFAKRGGHSEAHVSPVEVASIAALGYRDGLRDSGRDALVAALRHAAIALSSVSGSAITQHSLSVVRAALAAAEGRTAGKAGSAAKGK